MTPGKAVGIVNGHILWTDPREYLEACLYISTHRYLDAHCPPGIIITAKNVADAAVDFGEEKVLQAIREAKALDA